MMIKISALTKFLEFEKHRAYKYVLSALIVSATAVLQYAIYDFIEPAPYILF